MFCGNCGNKIPEDSLFCPFCGSRTINNADRTGGGAPMQTDHPAAGQASKGVSLPWPLIAAGILIFIIIGVLAWTDIGPYIPEVEDGQSMLFEDFRIEGKWKNVGEYTFGQVGEGAIVVFDGEHCNVYSPADTYAFYEEDGTYRLDCTSALFSETLSFTVDVYDNDTIEINTGDGEYLELTRIE